MDFKKSTIIYEIEVPKFKPSKVRVIYTYSESSDQASPKNTFIQHLEIKTPVHFAHLFLYNAQGTILHVKKQLSKFNSFKNSIKNLAKICFNLSTSLSKPIKYGDNTYIYDLRNFYPNNIAHLLAEIIPICLTVKSILSEDVIFVVTNPIEEPFKKLLSYFDIKTIPSNRRFEGNLLNFRMQRAFSAFNFNYESGGIFGSHPICFLNNVYNQFSF